MFLMEASCFSIASRLLELIDFFNPLMIHGVVNELSVSLGSNDAGPTQDCQVLGGNGLFQS